jgi:RNA polymerase sigma factor (sigma-70 family)
MPRGQLDAVARHVRRLGGTPAADALDDAALLERFVAGRDEEAFAALVRRHGGLVWSVCRHALSRREDAEDAFQATFLVLTRKAASIRRGTAVASWLYGVAYRTAMRVRKSAARRREQERQRPDRAPEQPVSEAALRELQALLDEEVQRLPEKYRAPFVLCCLEGKSRAEAARELGWKEGTVAGRVAQARERLRQWLARRGVAVAAALCAGEVGHGAPSALPAALAATTIQAALSCAGRDGPTAVATGAAALAEEVIRAAAATRLRIGLVFVPAVCVLGLGAGLAACQALSGDAPGANPPPAPAAGHFGESAPTSADGRRPGRTDAFGDPLPDGAVARLGTTRLRHGEMVRNLGFSPDGKTLLSADWHAVERWDAATGRHLGRFGDPRGRQFQSIAFSADARTVALSMSEGDVDVWEAASGRRVLQFHVGRFPALALSPDGKTLAVNQGAGDRPSLSLWDATTGKELRPLAGHSNTVHAILFSGDGKTLLSCGDDRTVRFWDVATGKQVRVLDQPNAVGQIALAPDGRTLAAVAVTKEEGKTGQGIRATWWKASEEVSLWDLASGKETHPLKGHENGVSALTFAPDGKTLVTCDWRTTHWWDVATGQELPGRRVPAARVDSLAFSPDGQTLATGGADQVVRLWDAATGREKLRPAGHLASVHGAAVSPDGRTLATAGGDGTVRLWDAATGAEIRKLVGHERDVSSVAFSADGRSLLSAGVDQTVRLWDPTTGKELRHFPGAAALLSPDDKLLVMADEKAVRVWDPAAGKELRQWPAVAGTALLGFSPDGRTLFTWGEDKVVRLWDPVTGREVRHFPGHHFAEDSLDRVYWVAVSPDGRLVAFGGQVGTIALYDTATGEELRRLTGSPGAVAALAFSPDSRTLASGDWTGGTVRLWEVASGGLYRELPGHRGRTFGMAFSPDGTRLVTANEDTTALVWDLTGGPSASAPAPLTARELDARWADLAGADATRAQDALRVLARSPEQAVALVRQRLRGVPPGDATRVARLIADLDSDDFKVRAQAEAELEKRAEAAERTLRRTVTESPSAEVSGRVKRVLDKLAQSPERLPALRAVALLEQIGTPAAREVLQDLSRGAYDARLTDEARTSVQRLAKRAAASP